MCRWLAYSGSPIPLEELLYKPEHSLIDQSLHARLGVETTNGDGFGVGWYGAGASTPVLFRSIVPVWNDRNLREIAGRVEGLAEQAPEVRTMFNNNRGADAPSAARRFRELVGQDPGPPPEPAQARLA